MNFSGASLLRNCWQMLINAAYVCTNLQWWPQNKENVSQCKAFTLAFCSQICFQSECCKTFDENPFIYSSWNSAISRRRVNGDESFVPTHMNRRATTHMGVSAHKIASFVWTTQYLFCSSTVDNTFDAFCIWQLIDILKLKFQKFVYAVNFHSFCQWCMHFAPIFMGIFSFFTCEKLCSSGPRPSNVYFRSSHFENYCDTSGVLGIMKNVSVDALSNLNRDIQPE